MEHNEDDTAGEYSSCRKRPRVKAKILAIRDDRSESHAACRKNSPAMIIRDELECLYEDDAFRSLYAECGQPGISPWQLAIVCILQFVEGLSDRQAADAVRVRIDWKYTLGLRLDDAGFDASVLSEFRGRLVEAGLEYERLNRQLQIFEVRGLLKGRGRQRTDSTRVLAAVRDLNRLMNVMETMRHAFESLAGTLLSPCRLSGSAKILPPGGISCIITAFFLDLRFY